MFLIRQGNQVNRPVIVSDTVEVVNNPASRQWLTMHLFPNKKMLSHITCLGSSRVVRQKYRNIALIFSSASSPAWTIGSSSNAVTCGFFLSTASTTVATTTCWLATVNTLAWILAKAKAVALPAPSGFRAFKCLTTIDAYLHA